MPGGLHDAVENMLHQVPERWGEAGPHRGPGQPDPSDFRQHPANDCDGCGTSNGHTENDSGEERIAVYLALLSTITETRA